MVRTHARAVSAASTSRPPLYAVAVTYLIHGLGYAGRTAESRRRGRGGSEHPGDEDHLWLNPRSARGVLRLVDDDLDGRARTWNPSRTRRPGWAS